MANARKKKTATFMMRAPKKAARKPKGKEKAEVLSARDWTVGSIAWNKDGNIVILDPRLAEFVRQRVRDDRELEIGIPRMATKVEKAPGREVDYDPYPDPLTPPINMVPPKPLGLCGCHLLRLHLAVEEAALNQPMFRDGVDSSSVHA